MPGTVGYRAAAVSSGVFGHIAIWCRWTVNFRAAAVASARLTMPVVVHLAAATLAAGDQGFTDNLTYICITYCSGVAAVVFLLALRSPSHTLSHATAYRLGHPHPMERAVH